MVDEIAVYERDFPPVRRLSFPGSWLPCRAAPPSRPFEAGAAGATQTVLARSPRADADQAIT
jgi:hypothetical protein